MAKLDREDYMDKKKGTYSAKEEAAETAKKPKLGSGGRFKMLARKLANKGASNPAGLAAYIGAKKYTRAKMTKWAAAGRAK